MQYGLKYSGSRFLSTEKLTQFPNGFCINIVVCASKIQSDLLGIFTLFSLFLNGEMTTGFSSWDDAAADSWVGNTPVATTNFLPLCCVFSGLFF